jgi:hypothetical protein
MPLPTTPFDGQIFIDAFRVKWVFDGEVECWRSQGQVPDIPVATSEQPGLMSAEAKNALNAVPAKGGGFGIIVDPKLAARTNENPDGIVFGDVEFLSYSLKIDCVHSDGSEVTADCQNVPFAPETGQLPPGFDVNFRELFLETICAEIPGGPGPVGNQGAKGETGRPGTGDGPVGAAGEDGLDATDPATFAGVRIEETDDIFDTAVVDLELNADEGRLHVVKANVKVPDDETPADKVITSSIFRALEFTGTGFEFNILKGQDELDANVTLANYPPGFDIESDLEVVQPNATKLNQYIQKVTAFYEGKIVEINDKYNQEIEEFFKVTDEAARQKLDILAEELANCEFRLPLEYCIGINPEDCQEGGAQIGAAVETQESGLCSLADLIFGDAFCDDPPGQDLGALKIGANEMEAVQYSGQATLPRGGYMIIYNDGVLFDSAQPGRGYYVGTSKTGVGVEAEITKPNGQVTTIKFPESGETFDKFDADSVEAAYQNGPLEERSINFFFGADGGSILVKAPTDTDVGTGKVTFRVIRCIECEDEPVAP